MSNLPDDVVRKLIQQAVEKAGQECLEQLEGEYEIEIETDDDEVTLRFKKKQ
jgi:hypothetical protein